ncbi:MAG: NnrU family protein [Saprospiraceae bacterium]
MNTFLFSVSVIIYYIIHSVMAHQHVKNTLYKIIPAHYYRILYSAISTIGLISLVIIYNGLEQIVMFHFPINYIGAAFTIIGITLITSSLLSFNLSEFFGLEQLKRKSETLYDTLNTKGLYKYVRHPLYLGFVIFFVGLFLFVPNRNILAVGSISIVYSYIGGTLEERRLLLQYGDLYKKYQETTPFIFPYKMKSK